MDIFVILILCLMLLEIFIFKTNIYSHQFFFSINIIFIIFLCYLILNNNESYYKLSYILCILLSFYSLSFSYLLIKYLNTNYFINIYLIATLNGGVGTILLLFKKYKTIMNIL